MATATPLHRVFCENVKARRAALGISQYEVARRLGVSQPTYAAIESGKAKPGLDTIERVATVLNIAPSDLLIEAAAVTAG